MKQIFSQQSTMSGVVMLALVVLAARAAGVDVAGLVNGVAADIAAVAGALAALAKIGLPDAPKEPEKKP